jgi:hypothetical protein
MATYALSGVCLNINSVPVAGAVVKIFDTATDTLRATATADGAGNYASTLSMEGPLYAVAYHPNSPDIAGTTLNTLMAVLLPNDFAPTYLILGF